MPTSEHLALSLDEAAGTLTLNHTASAVIDAVTLTRTRNDGLTIVGTAGDVPTEVALTIGLPGTAALDVNANTLDLSLEVTQAGGFAATSGFLGYNVGYLEAKVLNAPDLTASYVPAADSFTVQATNPGESIGAVQLLIGDDAVLEVPPEWSFDDRHVFSLIDDGTHGTAAARIVHLTKATLDLDASPTGETFDLETGQAARLNAYIETTPTSNLIPGHDILADCHIFDMPFGDTHFDDRSPIDLQLHDRPAAGNRGRGLCGTCRLAQLRRCPRRPAADLRVRLRPGRAHDGEGRGRDGPEHGVRRARQGEALGSDACGHPCVERAASERRSTTPAHGPTRFRASTARGRPEASGRRSTTTTMRSRTSSGARRWTSPPAWGSHRWTAAAAELAPLRSLPRSRSRLDQAAGGRSVRDQLVHLRVEQRDAEHQRALPGERPARARPRVRLALRRDLLPGVRHRRVAQRRPRSRIVRPVDEPRHALRSTRRAPASRRSRCLATSTSRTTGTPETARTSMRR